MRVGEGLPFHVPGCSVNATCKEASVSDRVILSQLFVLAHQHCGSQCNVRHEAIEHQMGGNESN